MHIKTYAYMNVCLRKSIYTYQGACLQPNLYPQLVYVASQQEEEGEVSERVEEGAISSTNPRGHLKRVECGMTFCWNGNVFQNSKYYPTFTLFRIL